MSEHSNNIYDFVTAEKVAYDNPIELSSGWDWSMKQHLRRSYLYLNSQFEDENADRDLRPNKNIVLPIMNIQYRTEGFDVKDITLYVDNPDEYFKSMLIKKFHVKWALENKIDTFIDDMVFSYCTYGGVLTRKTDNAKPDVLNLRSLAFCNQTSILDYPFAIRHVFSPAQLRKANKKWGDRKYGATVGIDELISYAKRENKKEIEVFEIHGLMPKAWAAGEDEYYDEDSKDANQIQLISYFTDRNNNQQGVTLFKHEKPTLEFKFLARDKVEDRALGRGGVEELFEPQVWTNWDEVKITEMLDSASKTLHWSDDNTFKSRNNLSDVENNEVLTLQTGKQIQQLNTYPRNLPVFNDSVNRWQEHAQKLGAASEGLLGESPTSGTPFKLFEAQNIEAKSMHKYRQGQLAVFMDEIYRDWILPHLSKEISKEQTFMDELSVDEMQEVVEKVMTKKTNQFKKNMILGLQEINEDLVEDYKAIVKQDVIKKGNKRFFKILAGEMKDANLKVHTSIAGKQKNLAMFTDKLVSLIRQYMATPQLRQDQTMTNLLNEIIESSGLSPIMFGSLPAQLPQQQQQPVGATQPIQQLGEAANQPA